MPAQNFGFKKGPRLARGREVAVGADVVSPEDRDIPETRGNAVQSSREPRAGDQKEEADSHEPEKEDSESEERQDDFLHISP